MKPMIEIKKKANKSNINRYFATFRACCILVYSTFLYKQVSSINAYIVYGGLVLFLVLKFVES